jgi:hypothetical protein
MLENGFDRGATYSRVVLLLVGLVGALGIADLGLEVVDVLGDVVTVFTSAEIAPDYTCRKVLPNADEVRPLQVRVDVDLDHTMLPHVSDSN